MKICAGYRKLKIILSAVKISASKFFWNLKNNAAKILIF